MERADQIINQLLSLSVAYAPKVLGAIVTLIIGWFIISWINRLVRKSMDKRGLDESLKPFLSSIISVGLKVLLLLSIAAMFGIKTTSFIAIFGALAFAIGMALQGSLGHFASGIMILVFRPFKVGDIVEIGGGKVGKVEKIEVFNTILKSLDNKRYIVPNNLVTSNIITNISGQEIIGVEMIYGISYNDDIDKARDIILEVGKKCPYILKDPAQGVVVAELADSSVNLATRPFCKSEHYWDTLFYMQENVKKALDEAGIGIPFPQMDVHIQK